MFASPETASLASGRPCPDRSRPEYSGKTALKVIAQFYSQGQRHRARRKLYVVLTAENIHPGKGTPVSQIEMRGLSDGVKIFRALQNTDQVGEGRRSRPEFNYL